MKFRYYITNTFNGTIEGTNSSTAANVLAAAEDYFVVDTETGEWLSTEGRLVAIMEINQGE